MKQFIKFLIILCIRTYSLNKKQMLDNKFAIRILQIRNQKRNSQLTNRYEMKLNTH